MDKKHNVAGVLTGKKSALKLIQKVAGLQVVRFFTRKTAIWRSIRNLFLDGDLRRKNRFNDVFFNACRKSYERRRSSNIAFFFQFFFIGFLPFHFLEINGTILHAFLPCTQFRLISIEKHNFLIFEQGVQFLFGLCILSRCLFEPLNLISFLLQYIWWQNMDDL